MLQFIRSKAGSFVVKIMFVLLIASFGIWGIGDFLRSTGPGEGSIITVGDQKTDAAELQNQIRRELENARRMFGAGLDMAQARQLGIVDRVVDRIVGSALMDEEAEHLRLVVGTTQIAQEIAQLPMFKGPTGQFDRGTFIGLLRANGLTESGYVALLHRDLPRQTLADLVGNAAATPKLLADALFRVRNEQRIAEWVFLPSAGVTGIAQPSPADLKDFYDKHPASFTAPEYRGFTALVLQTKDIAGEVQITADQVKDSYQQRIDEFTKIEKRHIQQILLPDEATAKLAEAALAKGDKFADVAKTIAKQDAGTIDLGVVAKTDLPPELADAAFTAVLNKPTAPVQSVLGWHILDVTAIEPGGVKTLDEAKAQVEADLRKEAEADALYKLSNKVEDAVAAGVDLGAIAQQFNLKPFVVKAIDQDAKTPDGKPVTDLPLSADTLLKPVFETAQGQTSGMQESQQSNAFFVVKVDSVTPPALKPFDDVASQVKDAWFAEQRTNKVADQAKLLRDSVKPDMPLAKLAAAQKLPLALTKPFTRSNLRGDAPIPPGLITELFKLAPGGVALSASPDGQYVAQLKEIRPADPAADPQVSAKLADTLEQQIGNELLQEFTDGLKQSYAVTINRAKLDQVVGGTPE